jgi:hypothetical protein
MARRPYRTASGSERMPDATFANVAALHQLPKVSAGIPSLSLGVSVTTFQSDEPDVDNPRCARFSEFGLG